MERVVLKDAVILTCKYDAEVTRRNCRHHAPHWPHVVVTEHSTLQGAPTEVTVCPGDSGGRLWICDGRYRYLLEWLIVDQDAERRSAALQEHDNAYWEAVELSDLEVGKVVCEGARRVCKNSSSHLPHVISSYDTVRGGTLDVYCPGLSGYEYGIYEYWWHGDAQQPDRSVIYIVEG